MHTFSIKLYILYQTSTAYVQHPHAKQYILLYCKSCIFAKCKLYYR